MRTRFSPRQQSHPEGRRAFCQRCAAWFYTWSVVLVLGIGTASAQNSFGLKIPPFWNTLGPWDARMRESDLAALAMTIRHNGAVAAEGVGAAALGHPAASTAWLANALLQYGVSLEPGDIVISGGITKMLPVRAGDRFEFSLTGQPSLRVSFR